MAPLYKPPIQVSTVEIPFLSMVTKADPDFERRKHWEVEYEFDAKVFMADPYVRGAYNTNSNIYAVGQPFGGQDAAVLAAKAPTAGSATPGLYRGTATGGWA
jgi:hypothetical protein